MLSALEYRAGETSAWYLSSGLLFSANVYNGDLVEFSGGQTLTSAVRTPSSSTSLGNVSLVSMSTTQALLVLPGGRQVTLQRYEFVGGGITAGRTLSAPETGWWWNATESGRGYFIEVQGSHLVALLMM